MTAPTIRVRLEGNRLYADLPSGRLYLLPSRKDWRKVRVWWKVAGEPTWFLTPTLAVRAALRKEAPKPR